MSLDTDSNKAVNQTHSFDFFKHHPILTGILIFIIAIIGWWKYEFPSATWRYKMTVTVETPEGIKTGFAVREVHASAQPGFVGVEAKVYHTVKGEAVVVDMGQGKYLFALMDIDGSYRIVRDVFPYRETSDSDYVRHYAALKEPAKSLDVSQYPAFVTFKDIKDLKTVTQVDAQNLSATFGKGVKLKDITLEMADADVTQKMKEYLGSRQMVGPYVFVKEK